MSKIADKYLDLLDSTKMVETEGAIFRVYKDRSYLGKKILTDLVRKRDGLKDGGGHGFYLGDGSKEVGLMSQLYGASGLFALINRYNVMDVLHSDGAQVDKLVRGIRKTVVDVLDYVEQYGYDMLPYIDKATNDELFARDPDNHYIGAMTWALSLFTATVKAIRNKTVDLKDTDAKVDNKKDLTAQPDQEDAEIVHLKGRLYKQIKYIITFFVDNFMDNDNGFGWGYCRGCEEPSLFFTYSVIEAFSDFEDNVMPIDEDAVADKTDWDTELLEYLNADLEEGQIPLEERYRQQCYKVGDKTWELYKKYLRTQFFSEKFNGTVTTISESEIRNTSRSPVLFNTLYVIFILFYSATNIRKERYDGGADRTDDELQEVVTTMTRGLQLVQNFYDDLKEEGIEGIVDKHILSFNQRNTLIPEFNKIINYYTIQVAPLLPMLVKANNLIAYWILKFPQQSMTDLFDQTLEAKNDNEWLWEKRKFDLLSTERYLEAIADYFDYYDTYERNYAAKVSNAKQMRKEITTEVEKTFQKRTEKADKDYERRLENELKRSKEQLRTSVRDEIEQDIRSEYFIEPQIEKKINAIFEAKADEFYEKYFVSRLVRIAEYNRLDSKSKEINELPEEVAQLKALIEDYIRSYFADAFRYANITWEDVGNEKFEKDTLADFNEFVKKYMGFAADNADRYSNKLHLSKVFDIIKDYYDKKKQN